MRNKLYILTGLTILVVALFLFSAFQSIKNARNCDQFVIDGNEYLTGINIPPRQDCKCSFFEEENIRVGIYHIDRPSEFIEKYGFEAMDLQNPEFLLTHNLLEKDGYVIPKKPQSLYQKKGERNGNIWTSQLDIETGKMWIEVKWESM